MSKQFLEDHLYVLQPVAAGQHQLSPRVIHMALQVCIYVVHLLHVVVACLSWQLGVCVLLIEARAPKG